MNPRGREAHSELANIGRQVPGDEPSPGTDRFARSWEPYVAWFDCPGATSAELEAAIGRMLARRAEAMARMPW